MNVSKKYLEQNIQYHIGGKKNLVCVCVCFQLLARLNLVWHKVAWRRGKWT